MLIKKIVGSAKEAYHLEKNSLKIMLARDKYQLIHDFLCVKGLVVHIEVSANLMFLLLLLFSSFEAVSIHRWSSSIH